MASLMPTEMTRRAGENLRRMKGVRAATASRMANPTRYRLRIGSRHLLEGRMAGATEHVLKRLPERHIDVFHRHGQAEIDQRGDAKSDIGDAAGDDCGEMRQLRLDIDGD